MMRADRNGRRYAILAAAVLCLTALVYWPLHDAGFFWIDKTRLHDMAWLRHGDAWQHLIFGRVEDYYWRPLVWTLFVAEVRAFDVMPGPMHLLSIGIHLANTWLVGAIALRLAVGRANGTVICFATLASMLIYGLHPALVEPVAWIGCQFELVGTFFMLLGLLLNLHLQRVLARAMAVASCFFLAACSKESAISFPILLLILDWMKSGEAPNRPRTLRTIAATQAPVYVGVFAAGLAYLALRWQALGFLLQPASHEHLPLLQRVQEVCFVYLAYLKIMLWPMLGLSPVHEIDVRPLAMLTMASVATDVAAIAIVGGSVYFAVKRNLLGALVLAATAALLPVLHIVPVAFDPSLYHERYAMTAIAMACTFLPALLANVYRRSERSRRFASLAGLVVVAWLFLAVLNIRVTIPLWSDEISMWRAVLRENPDSLIAKDHLLSTYLERENYAAARQLADQLMAEDAPCPTCMLNVANLAIVQGDAARAVIALEKAKSSRSLATQKHLVQGVVVAGGQLEELKGNFAGAEEAYRGAIGIDPLDPNAQMALAMLFAKEGRTTEARNQGEAALALFAPDERDSRRRIFEQAMARSAGNPDK